MAPPADRWVLISDSEGLDSKPVIVCVLKNYEAKIAELYNAYYLPAFQLLSLQWNLHEVKTLIKFLKKKILYTQTP